MPKNPREMMNEFMSGLNEVSQTQGDTANAFFGLLGASMKPGALDTKTKELISVAISVYAKCEYCIAIHVHKALEAGATRQEIIEAGMSTVSMGGGPALAYAVTLLKDAVAEFAPDFNK